MTGVLGFAGITGPDPDGWITWTTEDPALYNAQVLGPLRVRVEGSQIRVRMAVRPLHANVNGAIHGGATLGLIDVALFAILRASGASVAVATVTLDLSTQFLAPGRVDRPLDVVGEVLRETGRLAFIRGVAEQVDDDGTVIRTAAFQGTLRKGSNA